MWTNGQDTYKKDIFSKIPVYVSQVGVRSHIPTYTKWGERTREETHRNLVPRVRSGTCNKFPVYYKYSPLINSFFVKETERFEKESDTKVNEKDTLKSCLFVNFAVKNDIDMMIFFSTV